MLQRPNAPVERFGIICRRKSTITRLDRSRWGSGDVSSDGPYNFNLEFLRVFKVYFSDALDIHPLGLVLYCCFVLLSCKIKSVGPMLGY